MGLLDRVVIAAFQQREQYKLKKRTKKNYKRREILPPILFALQLR